MSFVTEPGEVLGSPAERTADGWVHVIGLAAGGLGAALLIAFTAARGHPLAVLPVAAYAVGLLAMLGFSAAYNMGRASRYGDVLRRLDHAAIFVMIAGTYTPFTTLALKGGWAVGMTVLVWSIATLGVALKLTLPQRRFEGLSVALYLAFGWIVLVAAGPLLRVLDGPILILLGLGGLVYSLGVVFHVWQRLPYQNAIWHAFVLVAAAIHYAAVWAVVL